MSCSWAPQLFGRLDMAGTTPAIMAGTTPAIMAGTTPAIMAGTTPAAGIDTMSEAGLDQPLLQPEQRDMQEAAGDLAGTCSTVQGCSIQVQHMQGSVSSHFRMFPILPRGLERLVEALVVHFD